MCTAAMSILYLMNNLLISKIYLSVPQCPWIILLSVRLSSSHGTKNTDTFWVNFQKSTPSPLYKEVGVPTRIIINNNE